MTCTHDWQYLYTSFHLSADFDGDEEEKAVYNCKKCGRIKKEKIKEE